MANSIRVIEPRGVFDSNQAEKFYQDVEQIAKGSTEIIVVDFKDVTFMDSSGLGILVKTLKLTQSLDVKLLLCSFNDQIKLLFELTGMDRVFEIYERREELESQIEPLSPTAQ
jgi:anti-sigma B factor antagonist